MSFVHPLQLIHSSDSLFILANTQTQTSKTIARQAGRTFVYENGLSQISYTDGGVNSLLLLLTCQTSSSIRAHQAGDHSYLIYIEDECACPGKCSYNGDGGDTGGLGGGAIFVIILVAVVGAYLLFGALFLRFARNQQGVEMIPHRAFWSQMGKDALGGGKFVIRKVRGTSSRYDSV